MIIVAEHGHEALPHGVEFAATLLAFSHGAVNPIIFMSLSKDFKHALCSLRGKIMKTQKNKINPLSQVQWPDIGAHSGIQVIQLQSRCVKSPGRAPEATWCHVNKAS